MIMKMMMKMLLIMTSSRFFIILSLWICFVACTCEDDEISTCRQIVRNEASSNNHNKILSLNNNDVDDYHHENLYHNAGDCVQKPYHTFTHICSIKRVTTSASFCCCSTNVSSRKNVAEKINNVDATFLCCDYYQSWNLFRCNDRLDQFNAMISLPSSPTTLFFESMYGWLLIIVVVIFIIPTSAVIITCAVRYGRKKDKHSNSNRNNLNRSYNRNYSRHRRDNNNIYTTCNQTYRINISKCVDNNDNDNNINSNSNNNNNININKNNNNTNNNKNTGDGMNYTKLPLEQEISKYPLKNMQDEEGMEVNFSKKRNSDVEQRDSQQFVSVTPTAPTLDEIELPNTTKRRNSPTKANSTKSNIYTVIKTSTIATTAIVATTTATATTITATTSAVAATTTSTTNNLSNTTNTVENICNCGTTTTPTTNTTSAVVDVTSENVGNVSGNPISKKNKRNERVDMNENCYEVANADVDNNNDNNANNNANNNTTKIMNNDSCDLSVTGEHAVKVPSKQKNSTRKKCTKNLTECNNSDPMRYNNNCLDVTKNVITITSTTTATAATTANNNTNVMAMNLTNGCIGSFCKLVNSNLNNIKAGNIINNTSPLYENLTLVRNKIKKKMKKSKHVTTNVGQNDDFLNNNANGEDDNNIHNIYNENINMRDDISRGTTTTTNIDDINKRNDIRQGTTATSTDDITNNRNKNTTHSGVSNITNIKSSQKDVPKKNKKPKRCAVFESTIPPQPIISSSSSEKQAFLSSQTSTTTITLPSTTTIATSSTTTSTTTTTASAAPPPTTTTHGIPERAVLISALGTFPVSLVTHVANSEALRPTYNLAVNIELPPSYEEAIREREVRRYN